MRTLSRFQKCGCQVCICENEEQCQGCGAKNCGTHPVGEIPKPVYAECVCGGQNRCNICNPPVLVIDCTPTWESLVLDYAQRATEGNAMAREELIRMARIADSAKKK